jgi:predicted GIY-YIG superfamily endonuclease
MFWVYIVQNPAGRFYVGHTDNLQNRIASHNRTDKVSGKFTRKNGPWILMWVRKTSESRRGNATGEADQKLEICASDSGASSESADVAQWWSPDAVGINRLVVGSNPTVGAKFQVLVIHSSIQQVAAFFY